MSVKIVTGNIFESTAEVLVNPVNTVGVCGAGLALEFKKKYPDNFKAYQEYCKTYHPSGGDIMPSVVQYDYKKIINFFTKEHFADRSRFVWIDKGLKALKDFLTPYSVKDIAMPALGCGLGDLDWHDVRDLVLKYFDEEDKIKVFLYLPKTQRTRNIFKNNPVDLMNI